MRNRQKLPGLTALKGLFIWMIVLHNTSLLDVLLDGIPGMAFIRLFGGSLGNSMFFMISGFLMSWGYRDRIREGSICFGEFLGRRLKKLYPVYAWSNVAALAVSVWQYGVSAINLKRCAFTFLLMGGVLDKAGPYNTPTWFVPALAVCYGIYYAGAYWTKSATAYRVFLAGMLAVGYYISGTELNIPLLFDSSGTAYLNFFAGCILAEVYPQMKLEKKRLRMVECLLLSGLLLSVYLMLRYGVEIISGGSAAAFTFVICPVVLYLAYEEGIISRILSWKSLQFLGRISMGVFYWHLVIYIALRYVLGGMTMLWFGAYLLMVLIAGILTDSFSGRKVKV